MLIQKRKEAFDLLLQPKKSSQKTVHSGCRSYWVAKGGGKGELINSVLLVFLPEGIKPITALPPAGRKSQVPVLASSAAACPSPPQHHQLT